MARMARIVVPEYPHHVTQRGVRSLPILRGNEDRRSYLEFMSRETQRFEGVRISYVLEGQVLKYDSAAKPPLLVFGGPVGRRRKVIYAFELAWGLKGEQK